METSINTTESNYRAVCKHCHFKGAWHNSREDALLDAINHMETFPDHVAIIEMRVYLH